MSLLYHPKLVSKNRNVRFVVNWHCCWRDSSAMYVFHRRRSFVRRRWSSVPLQGTRYSRLREEKETLYDSRLVVGPFLPGSQAAAPLPQFPTRETFSPKFLANARDRPTKQLFPVDNEYTTACYPADVLLQSRRIRSAIARLAIVLFARQCEVNDSMRIANFTLERNYRY